MRNGELLNTSGLSRELGLDRTTVREYIAVLERLFLVQRLLPWHRNVGKRLVRTPKMHVVDSGLAAMLAGLGPGDWIAKRDRMGHLLESFVAHQLVTLAGWTDPDIRFWHFRDKDGQEVDLVMTLGNRTWGMEVKATSTPRTVGGPGNGAPRGAVRERLRGGNPVLQWSRHPAAGRARHAGGAGERIVDAVVGPTREGRMHRVVLVLILLPTTLPAAAQTTVGVRAGLGSAKMAVPGSGYDAKGEPDSGTISTSYVQSSRSVDGDREHARR